MLIHATITVTGEKEALAACEARMRRLLSSQERMRAPKPVSPLQPNTWG